MSGTASKPRVRLSLTNLLLLTAVVALSITVAMLWREVGPLRREVYRLRDEVGELVIRDKTKLHAIQVPVESTLTRREWRWRVWWPEGESYRMHHAEESIPQDGYPKSSGWSTLQGGAPTVISVIATKDAESDRWSTRLAFNQSGAGGGGFGSSTADWLGKSSVAEHGGVHQKTKLFDVGEPVVLCRYRTSAEVNSSADIPDPSDGFMIWLEPVP